MSRIRQCLPTILLLAAVIAGTGRPARADVLLQHVDVFTAGVGGYASYRIPSISQMADGTLVAVAEGRYSSSADPGGTHIDLVERRSTDGGQTWSTLQVLDRNPASSTNLSTDKTAAGNPVSVVDATTNKLWVFDLRLPNGVSANAATTGQLQTWARYSGDDGQTWSTAQQITVPQYGKFYPNIGSGIQMSNGRLVVPATAYPTAGSSATQSFALYSDDDGTTWKAGALIGSATNEQQVVQLANGNLLSNARQNAGTHRVLTTSTDGGATWGTPVNGPAVTTVAAGLLRYTQAGVNGATANQILFSYPAGTSTDARAALTIATSTDEGQTYTNGQTLYQGYGAYSDMFRLGGDQVGTLWERGTNEHVTTNAGYQEITYTTFNSQFLNPTTATGLLASESFGYAAGSLGRAIGGNGWNSTWAATNLLANASTATVVAQGLTRTGLNYTPTAGAASLQGAAMSRGLGVPLDLSAGHTYYVSALVDRATTTGTASAGLDFELLGSTGTEQVGFGATATNDEWYLNQGGTVAQTPTANAVGSGLTYLLVSKLVVVADGSEQLSLAVYNPDQPIPATDVGINWTLAESSARASTAIASVLIQGGSDADWLADEVRVGTTWDSVAAPEPSALTLGLVAAAPLMVHRRRRVAGRRLADIIGSTVGTIGQMCPVPMISSAVNSPRSTNGGGSPLGPNRPSVPGRSANRHN